MPGGAGRRVEQSILVGEAHQPAIGGELMDMGAPPQRSGRERGDEIAGVEGLDDTGSARADDHAAATGGAVAPVGGGMLGAEDEHHPVVDGAHRDDAAAGTLDRLVEHLNPSGRHLDPFDPRPVEACPGGIRADVVHQPLPVGGPDPGVGEEMAVGGGGDLAFGHGSSMADVVSGRMVRGETEMPERGAGWKSTQGPPTV